MTSYGAAGNGSTNSTQAIQNAVNACNSGDTVVFPAGTYVVSSSITLKSNCTYSGQGAVLQGYTGTGLGGFPIFRGDWSRQNITITGLTFNGGGIDTSGGASFARNIVITGNTFENLVNSGWWFHTAIIDGFGFDHSTISNNKFTNIADGGQLLSGNYDQTKTAIGFYHANYLTIDSNTFDLVNEGIHLAYDPSHVGAWGSYDSLRITNNTFTRMHRIPIEIQGYYMTSTVISGNRMSSYYNPNENSYGISFASDSRGTVIDGNDMDASVPAANRYGFCMEVWGTGTRTTNNICRASASNPKGQWVSDVTLGYWVSGSTVVQGNTFCGVQPVAWGQVSYESWWQAGYAPPPVAGQLAAATSSNTSVLNCGSN